MIASAVYVCLLPNGRWRVTRQVRGRRPEVLGYARTRVAAQALARRA